GVTIVLCLDYSSDATDIQAQYTAAATLALARKIEETGRRVELWASILTHDAHHMRQSFEGISYLRADAPQQFDELDHCVVKRADEQLQGPAIAALCSMSLLRHVYFQVWKLQYLTLGFMQNYGSATDKHEVY